MEVAIIEKEQKINNIRVIYNGLEINKRSIFKNNFIMGFGSTMTIITIFVLIFAVPEHIISTAYGIVLSMVGSIGIMIGGIGLTYFIYKNSSPAHCDFVEYIMKFKENQLEFGTFNGEYMIKALGRNGWQCLKLGHFICEDFNNVLKALLIADRAEKKKR